MALRETEQILDAFKRSTKPLICIAKGAGADGYASAIGLAHVLQKLDKHPHIVAADGLPPKSLHFLPGHEQVRAELKDIQRLVITIDTHRAKPADVSHTQQDETVRIVLSPKSGQWSMRDVHVSHEAYAHDLVICIGATDLNACADFYRSHADFFHKTPIINIDHDRANEQFGQFNIVDITATSCGEVCHDLIESLEPGLLDADSATAFLAGMIAKTKSFKQTNVTPKTLEAASKLMARGAKRDLIVQHLYRTRSVPTLRLWGRALARLKERSETKLVWTLLSQQDFLHAGAEERDLPDVLDELLASSPDVRTAVLLHEDREGGVCVILHAEHPLDARSLLQDSVGKEARVEGTRTEARTRIASTRIVEAERRLVEALTKHLSQPAS